MAKRKRTSRTDPRLRKPKNKRRAKLIGDRLRALREGLGLSQSTVAISLNWQPSRLWEYETGRSAPRTPALMALAAKYGVSLDVLLEAVDGHGCNGSAPRLLRSVAENSGAAAGDA